MAFALLGHLLVGEGLPGLLRGVLGMIELVSSQKGSKTAVFGPFWPIITKRRAVLGPSYALLAIYAKKGQKTAVFDPFWPIIT